MEGGIGGGGGGGSETMVDVEHVKWRFVILINPSKM